MTQTAEKPNPIQKSEPVKASPLYGLAARFQIDPGKLVDVLRGTVIKPDKNGKQATNEEVAAFCIVANMYGLNPFTREIHAFTQPGKGVVPIVGVDGWAKIVNATDKFDGCEFEEIATEGGLPSQITCKMYVKGRTHPVCATERYVECVRDTAPWKGMPWRMLRHKAYIQAARYAFGLAGIFDEDEARDIDMQFVPLREPVQMPRAVEAPNGDGAEGEKPETKPADDLPATDQQHLLIRSAVQAKAVPEASVQKMLKSLGAKSLQKLSVGQADKMLAMLEEHEKQEG